MIPVLFTMPKSIYLSLGCDCYDKKRDARTWQGGTPAIFHPPCRLFSKMRAFSTAPKSEKRLAYWAVRQVRKNGGVLEHPAYSTLWKERKLPKPGQSDKHGFTIDLDQYWFGHPAQKRTWLYICGISGRELPEYPLVLGRASFIIGKFASHKLPEVKQAYRSATPEAFAQWLIEIVRLVEEKRQNRPKKRRSETGVGVTQPGQNVLIN